MMSMLEVAFFLIAYLVICQPFVLLSLLTVWMWRGRSYRSRFWARTQNGIGLLVASTIFASLSWGLVVAPFGVFQPFMWVLQLAGASVGVWALLITLVGSFWWPAQRLFGPKWWTMQTREEMEQSAFEGKDPFQSALARVGAPSVDTRKPYWLGRELRRWHGARLMDPVCPSRRDRYLGDLWVCEGGVWFDLPGASERVQNTVSVAFSWEQMLRVSQVGDNKNATGLRVSGVLNRSLLTRLALETIEGIFLFEVASWRAAQAARFISEVQEGRHAC